MKIGTLCYIKHNGKTLMLHRVKKENDMHEGKWNGLGGKLEAGETPEECIIREVKEESGLTIYNPNLRGILTFPKFDGIDDWMAFLFTATQFEGELIDSPEGNLEWIEDTEVFNLNLWPGDRIFLNWVEENRFFSGKFIYKNKKLIDHSVIFHDI
ncbi:MAG: 8-oxo-dGTP diphosphatase [Candidatus Latescibacteria bacterium]|jgi:8-oxo-dGTP diphosphatase|nr:8-oxo-dGTP diphosphatase [Candidatus Latescibacterota bacterium]MBT5829004.1 8-oxo-dGTP diphosphatase [Candidatus Latescibacterota bacterium]